MTTDTQIQARSYNGEADLPPICELVNLCDKLDKLDDNYSPEDLRLEFDHPEIDKAADLRLWEDETGRLVAFGELWRHEIVKEDKPVLEGYLYFRVHPDVRDSKLPDQILAWGQTRLIEANGQDGLPIIMAGHGREHESFTRAVLERNGFILARYFFRMERSLELDIPDPQFPTGYTLRHVNSESDIAAWVEAFNLSFIDHYNHHNETVEAHKHWLQAPQYRPEHDLVAVAPDGTFAAFCFCEINPEDNQRNNRNDGWIEKLGTRRGYRQQGLGRAMLLAGLQRLKASGATTARLGVDAANPTGALRLYEAVGFERTLTSVLYEKPLA